MAKRHPLSLIGATFLRVESNETPMHVGALTVVAPPISYVSYGGQQNLGFTGSRDTLPHLQGLALHTSDAVAELGCSLDITTTRRPRSLSLAALTARGKS